MVEKYGTQIVAERGDERKVRDAQRWKKVEVIQRQRYGQKTERSRYQEYLDIGAGMQDQGQETNQRALRDRESQGGSGTGDESRSCKTERDQ